MPQPSEPAILKVLTNLGKGMAMTKLREIDTAECIELLAAGVVGRAAICTPSGPHVVPVNYTVHQDSVIFRTTPYSVLGMFAWSGDIAFEVDHVDVETHEGWSVVAVGKGELIDDTEELEEIRWGHDPKPWAQGPRHLYVRIRWREITGRRIS